MGIIGWTAVGLAAGLLADMRSLPDTMKRAMAKQAAALGDASDIMMAHPLALQLRNLQSLVEIGVDKNTTVVFPAPS